MKSSDYFLHRVDVHVSILVDFHVKIVDFVPVQKEMRVIVDSEISESLKASSDVGEIIGGCNIIDDATNMVFLDVSRDRLSVIFKRSENVLRELFTQLRQ